MTDNNKQGFAAEIALLERRIEELLIAVDSLKEENRALRQRRQLPRRRRLEPGVVAGVRARRAFEPLGQTKLRFDRQLWEGERHALPHQS